MRPGCALLACLMAAMLVGACAPPRPMSRERVENVTPAESPYNFHRGREALTRALAEEEAGKGDAAQATFRQAALMWPGLTEAWEGLARTSDGDEAEAANFLARRTALTDPNDILTQREVALALRTYLDEQRALPDANPRTIEYGTQLVGLYEDLYQTRGTYNEPLPFGNIKPNEMPTAIITGLATSIYIGTVFTGTESAR